MTELEKIKYAKSFIDKLANGVNPLDDSSIPDEDIVNHVRISRCFFYVSDILQQVIDNGGTSPTVSQKTKKEKFKLSEDVLSNLPISEEPLTIKEIANLLNRYIDQESMQKISPATINKWLLKLGFLEITYTANEKRKKIPTDQGLQIGIFAENRSNIYGPYTVVLFTASAQQFIYDNLDALLEKHKEKNGEDIANQGKAWSEEHDECLIDLFKKEVPVTEIAVTLKRSETGIRSRLKKLGLIEHRSDAK